MKNCRQQFSLSAYYAHAASGNNLHRNLPATGLDTHTHTHTHAQSLMHTWTRKHKRKTICADFFVKINQQTSMIDYLNIVLSVTMDTWRVSHVSISGLKMSFFVSMTSCTVKICLILEAGKSITSRSRCQSTGRDIVLWCNSERVGQ